MYSVLFLLICQSSPLDDLQTWLKTEPDKRPSLADQAFAKAPLTKDQARQAADLLWRDHVAKIKRTSQSTT